MASGRPRDWVFVIYNTPNSLWHQLGQVASLDGSGCLILILLTPDNDIYATVYDGTSADVAAVRFADARGTLPWGIARDRVYRFRADLSAPVLAEALEQGGHAATDWWAAQTAATPQVASLLLPLKKVPPPPSGRGGKNLTLGILGNSRRSCPWRGTYSLASGRAGGRGRNHEVSWRCHA